jgi:hypothetical protein
MSDDDTRFHETPPPKPPFKKGGLGGFLPENEP